jgi:hypothetical protein
VKDFIPYREYQARRQRDALAAAKQSEERNRDPELEQCLIAYSVHRVDGGTMRFAEFKRQWYQEIQEPKDGR